MSISDVDSTTDIVSEPDGLVIQADCSNIRCSFHANYQTPIDQFIFSIEIICSNNISILWQNDERHASWRGHENDAGFTETKRKIEETKRKLRKHEALIVKGETWPNLDSRSEKAKQNSCPEHIVDTRSWTNTVEDKKELQTKGSPMYNQFLVLFHLAVKGRTNSNEILFGATLNDITQSSIRFWPYWQRQQS